MKKLLPLLLALAAVSAPAAAVVRISEVGSAVTDPWGNATSFVELRNAGDEAVPLESWAIRRTQKGKNKDIVLPAYTLAAGAYAVVWGSDDFPYEKPAVVVSGNVLREGVIKFKASNTPLITLLDPDRAPVDSFQMLAALADEMSMGPAADPGTDRPESFFSDPSPLS